MRSSRRLARLFTTFSGSFVVLWIRSLYVETDSWRICMYRPSSLRLPPPATFSPWISSPLTVKPVRPKSLLLLVCSCSLTTRKPGVDQHHQMYASSASSVSISASAYNSTTLQQQSEIASSTSTPSLTKQIVAFSSSPHVPKMVADRVLNRRLGE